VKEGSRTLERKNRRRLNIRRKKKKRESVSGGRGRKEY
jgi:hypothetical protein